MKLKKWLAAALCAAITLTGIPLSAPADVQAETVSRDREVLNFNTDWLYSNIDHANGASVNLDDSAFDQVSVPHANTILTDHSDEDFESQIASYRFVSWYRRHFALSEEYAGRNIVVEFEGVATVAEVYINGKKVIEHRGAYTGFTADITDYVYTDGRDNVLAVRVDSTRQPDIPPEGGNVDYCLFGGIVRDVSLRVTEPVYVERTFVTTPDLEEFVQYDEAAVNAQIDITNNLTVDKTYTVMMEVKDMDGNVVGEDSIEKSLPAGQETTVELTDYVDDPHLWHVDDPYLYTMTATILDGDTQIDSYDTRFGMRYFWFGDGTGGDGNFYLNGEKLEVVGINRHEQWPWIGRAVPDKLQVQDADLIKANGINLVRCSHYPQDPSFMDRCDEIGLMVFTEAPGWQHLGGDLWRQTFKTNLVELILRDRNHPSVISWGVTPNESSVNTAFNKECNTMVKELDPTRPTHGVRVEFDYPYGNGNEADTVVTDILTVNYTYQNDSNHVPPHMPYIITEHSNDWWGNGRPDANDTNAQAFIDSFARVIDAYYANDCVAGGIGWSMFDYNNEVNYTNSQHVFYSGIYDIWRHEKTVAYVYKSQMDVEEAGPIVYIANNWTAATSSTVYVMSNCDEIELFVNDTSLGKITPNKYTNLPHPIFEFKNVAYKAGELKAVGYVDGEAVEEFVRATPGEAVALKVEADYDTLVADGTDMTSVSVTAVDADGNEVPFAANKINVVQTSGVETTLIQEKDVALEGGQVAFLVQSKRDMTGEAEFEVISDGLESGTCTITIEDFEAENLVPVSENEGYETPMKPTLTDIDDTQNGTGVNKVNYAGTWTYTADGICYNGGNTWSETAGDTFTFKFSGTSVQMYATVANNHGNAAVSIDGGEEVLINEYATSRQGNFLVFDSGALEDGEHTMTVRVLREKSTASDGYYVTLDRLVVGSLGDVTKEALEKAVEDAIPDTEKDLYTEESWAAYKDALAEAEEVLADKKATQKEVDLARKAIIDAKNGLSEAKEPLPYEDVTEADWFYESVAYTYYEGLMTGMDPTHFGPYGQLSRAQFALILYRIQGEPEVKTEKSFGDISGDEWYGPAVLWAAEAGIVGGYLDGNFGAADNITREQMALMMYRYAKYLGKDMSAAGDYNSFKDAASVSGFAAEAMQWAVGKGIITGKENGTMIDPQGNTARAEAAAIIQRFMK